MKHVSLAAYAGTLACVGVLTIGAGRVMAQGEYPPPATKQPPAPSGKPPDPTPATPSKGKGQAEKAEAHVDGQFAMKAAEGGILEVELGRIASSRASNDEVKKFAQQMIDDHGKANDELKSIAGGKQITLPDESKVKSMHQGEIARLEKLEGAAFDKAYMSAMVKDHDKTVALFEREEKNGRDPDLKAFATKTLPTIREHHKLAKEIHDKLGGKGTE